MLERIFEKTSFKDALIILIAAFAAVSFWRGIWGLMDSYLFPQNSPTSYLVSLIISLIILLLISLYKKNKPTPKKK